jgi:hypothetical protein
MAHISADRVRDTSTSTGTGTFVVSGTAPTAFVTFSAVCTTSDTFYYAIQHQTANEWEVGLGTYSSANTITRTTVYASSASGSAVTFSAGTKDVFITLAAARSVQLDNNGAIPGITDAGNLTFTGTSRRITGDFSNATIANRVMFQSSTANSQTSIGVLPNGTNPTTNINLFNGTDPANSSIAQIVNTTGEVSFRSILTGTGTYLPMTFHTGGSERMRVDTSGNVGVGTSSPTQKLDVYAASGVLASTVRVAGTTGSDQAFVIAQAGSNVAYMRQDGNGGSFLTAPNNWAVFTNSGERMRIDSSGNVGIGTSSPLQRFNAVNTSITGGAPASSGSAADPNAVARLQAGSVAMDIGVYSAGQMWIQPRSFTNYATNYDLVLQPNGGNVGIGTSSPATKLQVTNSTASDTEVRITNGQDANNVSIGKQGSSAFGQTAAGNGFLYTASDWSMMSNGGAIKFATGGSTERARIDTSGNLLWACTSTNDTVSTGFRVIASSNGYVAHTITSSTNGTGGSYYLYSTGAGSYRFYVGAGGTVFATSTTITAISDQRLKENIQDIDVGLDAIMALKPRKFDWKAGKGKDKKGDRGWIAQEFEQVFPDMIDTWRDPPPDGEEPYKAVNADLIPVLVKAIQELKAQNDELKARVAALENA